MAKDMKDKVKKQKADPYKIYLPLVVGKGYKTFWNWKGRYRVCKGSRASKKSKTAALWYIANMMKYKQANLLVVRKVFRTLKDSCFSELKWAIRRLKAESLWTVKESPLEMTYKPTGQKIFFRGLDDPLKITSIAAEKGCLCWCWVEEAYEITAESDFNMLDESIRGIDIEKGEKDGKEDIFKQITLTFNPWNEHHWLKKRFFDIDDGDKYDCEKSNSDKKSQNTGNNISQKPLNGFGEKAEEKAERNAERKAGENTPKNAEDAKGDSGVKIERMDYEKGILAMTTNYTCNEWLDEGDRRLFEAMKINNPRRYQVAGLGNWGISEGLIYENWIEQAFDVNEIRKLNSVRAVFGLDFGYTNDPTALFCGLADQSSKTLWVFDELYKKGMSNEEIAREIISMGYSKEKITADSAEPKSIDRLYALGIIRIRSASKGRDSINSGIDLIKCYKIIIHPKCVNFITEISNYTWEKDSDRVLNKPSDSFNHLMDAMRYAMEDMGRGERFSFE